MPVLDLKAFAEKVDDQCVDRGAASLGYGGFAINRSDEDFQAFAIGRLAELSKPSLALRALQQIRDPVHPVSVLPARRLIGRCLQRATRQSFA